MDNVKYRFLGIPIWEKRSGNLGTFKAPSSRLVDIMGGESSTGMAVTQNTALTFSAVWACVRIISNTVAMLPFGVYKTDSNGEKHRTPTHASHRLIHSEPNQIQSSFTWRQVMQAHATLKGNAYSIIKRNAMFRPVELKLISNPDHVTPYEFEGDLYYKIQGYDKPFLASDIFHIRGLGFDGLAGKSVLSVARESIGSALAMQKYGGTIFKNGGAKRVALMHDTVVKDANVRKNITDSWNNTYGGPDKLNKVALIDAGFKVQEIGMNPEDAQFIGSREFSVNEIARYFGLIMDLLATDNNPTYASAEQRALDFIKYTMTPWLVTWESEVNRKLFPDREKDTFYSKFTLEGLLRGDAAARAQYYKDMFYIGALSRDEIRQLEDRNKIAGGEKYYLQSNMAEADKLQDIHNKNNTPKNENS
jgi:HK97 family phage portal protein